MRYRCKRTIEQRRSGHMCGAAKCENYAKICERNAAKCEKQSTLNVKIPLNVEILLNVKKKVR